MKTLLCALLICFAQRSFASTAANKNTSSITCSNSWIKINATLSQDFKISNASYFEKDGGKSQHTLFEYGQPQSKTVTRGPDSGKLEFFLGLLENCNAYLRIPAKAPYAKGTLRMGCPDGGRNSPLTCAVK